MSKIKKTTLIIGGIVVVLLLAGAVFVGARLLATPRAEAGGSGGMVMVSKGGAGGPVAVSFEMKPAPELPATPADVGGLFVRQEDNSIFVGTGEINFRMTRDAETGQQVVDSNYSGPVLEVVLTRDTTVYRDETKMPSPDQASASSGKVSVQQVVQPVDSLEKLDENTEIQVWGERRGDRVIAQVFVYRQLGRN